MDLAEVPTTTDVTAKVFENVLAEIEREMPYNSAVQFIDIFGDGVRKRELGAACIYQTLESGKRVHERTGLTPLFVRDARHLAVLFDYDGGLVLLDPYLLHLRPIHITAAHRAKGSVRIVAEAAPLRFDASGTAKPARLTVRYLGNDDSYAIRVEYSRFSPTKGKYVMSRLFTLRSSEVFTIPDPNTILDGMSPEFLQNLLTDPEQTSLSVRAMGGPSLRRTAEAILPLHGYAERPFTADDVWVRDSMGVMRRQADAAAQPVWSELIAFTGVDRDEILEHLVRASEIYRGLADPDGDVEPYSLENE